jgi:hypothetical protein
MLHRIDHIVYSTRYSDNSYFRMIDIKGVVPLKIFYDYIVIYILPIKPTFLELDLRSRDLASHHLRGRWLPMY